MQRVLFHSTIFGPIHSRRLGTSLGVNLSPTDGKVCSFDCLYCEAGFNAQGPGTSGLPTREQVRTQLEHKLKEMHSSGQQLDVITFSGNGEPTMHPDFENIIDDTISARDRYFPEAKVSVLCNSTRLGHEDVVRALHRVDNCILKLDSAVEGTMRTIDRPLSQTFTIASLLPQLISFGDKCIIQTMMLRGSHDEKSIDNTTPEEIEALAKAYRAIKPREVMLYSIDRATPAQKLEKVPASRLSDIAAQLSRLSGVPVISF